MMSEQLISQIRTLAKTEKYKQDSFFFCGSPSDMPNTALLNACEAYLDAASGNRQDPELKICREVFPNRSTVPKSKKYFDAEL